jgi:hypothetical protein
MYYDPNDSNRVELCVNKYNPVNNFVYNISAGAASKPTFSAVNGYLSKIGTQYFTLVNPSEITSDTQGELCMVGRSAGGTTTNQFVALAATNPTSNNGLCRMGHYRSNDTFANAWHITHIDAGGVTTRLGFVDADHTTFKMININSNGTTNAMYSNKVAQVLTGPNTGKWLAAAVGTTVVDFGVWRVLAGLQSALCDCKFILYTNAPLTDSERSSLYDWLVSQGILA